MVKIKYDHWLPKFIGVQGITLYPYILLAFPIQKNYYMDEVVAHEFVHVEQIKSVGFFTFYISYLYEYIRGRFKGLNHNQSYMEISYEKQAYLAQNTNRFMQIAFEERSKGLQKT